MMNTEPLAVWRALKFLVLGPVIVGLLWVVNWMVSPGVWWVKWAALGIGIAWVFSLLRVVRAAALLGGLSALTYYFLKKR